MAELTQRIIGLDLVRAAAIAMVLVAQMVELTASQWLATWFFTLGGLVGVETCFALRGVLVGGILFRRHVGGTLSLGRCWRRRWLRTIPANYAVLTIQLLLTKRLTGLAVSWPEWPYLLYLQNLGWQHPIFSRGAGAPYSSP